MFAEQTVRAFWPLWIVVALIFAPLMMGWHEVVPQKVLWGVAAIAGLALIIALAYGVRKFRLPFRAEAVARVDASLPGRPIAALADEQAIGAGDPASKAVWRTHLERMAARTREARAVAPNLQISNRDPYGLRFIATLFFVCALLFGSLWRVANVAEVVTGDGLALASGPVWEGWIEPPAYTGKPPIYLADIPVGEVDVSEGSRITLRLYGEVGSLRVEETLSGQAAANADTDDTSAAQQSFEITRNGQLSIIGDETISWRFNVVPDLPPTIEITGPVDADAMGQMALPFRATDDYAVAFGEALIELDLSEISRNHGLLRDPELRDPLIVDLPLPYSGDRSDFEELLVDDFSQHPFANLPVTLTLSVSDANAQSASGTPEQMILPGRRFFQPVARAVVEQRRDLLWTTENGPRVLRLLRAISHRPEDIFTGETVYLRFREIQRNLQTALESDTGLTAEARDELANAMWELALQLEEGSLADARERLARAQERLEEAMRNGATNEEIAELMQELREATSDYMQLLADETDFAEQTDQPDQGESGESISQGQIQEMMDEIQRLMEEGNMAEAAELMQELNELMENLEITQGEGGEGGPQTPGQQSMEDLQDQLREQQELSDDAFRDLQEQFNGGQQPSDPGQDPGQQPGTQDGQQDGEQPGQDGSQQSPGQSGTGQSPGDTSQGQGQQSDQGPGGEGIGENGEAFPPGAQGTLAERQQALRGELDRLRDGLPALSGEEAEAARRAIEQAERAMEGAEQALRDNDLPEALDRQAEAMEAMREGMRSLGRALAENQEQRDPGQSEADGGAAEGQSNGERRDPLGRQTSNNGQFGTDDNLLQGADVYRRAEELLEELRRRAAEQDRPTEELDYLKRLLDRF